MMPERFDDTTDHYSPVVQTTSTDRVRRGRLVVGAIAYIGAGLLALLVVALLARTFTIAAAIKEQQKQNTAQAATTTELLELIQDCTRPQGKCAKRTAAQDAAQVGSINAATYAAAWCAVTAPRSQTYKGFLKCVADVQQGKIVP